MKKVLLASSALALLGGAQQAQAGTYFSVLGGANWFEDLSAFSTTDIGSQETSLFVNSDADTGFLLGAAIGINLDKWAKGLRGEFEVSYRRQDLGGAWLASVYDSGVFDETWNGPIDGNQSTFAMMANVWYDFEVGWKIKPYIGGGAGWARARAEVAQLTTTGADTMTTTRDEDNGFAWQLGLGFNYEVQPGVDLGFGYRYFQGPDNEVFFVGKFGSVSPEYDGANHSALLSLKVDID